ncbi:hypothetical protein D3C71_1153410 [compost metagenome]
MALASTSTSASTSRTTASAGEGHAPGVAITSSSRPERPGSQATRKLIRVAPICMARPRVSRSIASRNRCGSPSAQAPGGTGGPSDNRHPCAARRAASVASSSTSHGPTAKRRCSSRTFPACSLAVSSASSTTCSNARPPCWMRITCSCASAGSGTANSSSLMPRTPVSGVRTSWPSVARYCALACAACSARACRRAAARQAFVRRRRRRSHHTSSAALPPASSQSNAHAPGWAQPL